MLTKLVKENMNLFRRKNKISTKQIADDFGASMRTIQYYFCENNNNLPSEFLLYFMIKYHFSLETLEDLR